MTAAQATNRQFTVDVGQVRLDQFLAGTRSGLTRAQLHRLIVDGQVRLNGSLAKPSQRVRRGDLPRKPGYTYPATMLRLG